MPSGLDLDPAVVLMPSRAKRLQRLLTDQGIWLPRDEELDEALGKQVANFPA